MTEEYNVKHVNRKQIYLKYRNITTCYIVVLDLDNDKVWNVFKIKELISSGKYQVGFLLLVSLITSSDMSSPIHEARA